MSSNQQCQSTERIIVNILSLSLSLSLRFNGHFPGEPGLARVYTEAKDDGGGEW